MGIGFLICVINLLIAPVSNVLMRLCCQVQGTEDFSRQSDFFYKLVTIISQSHTCAWLLILILIN